VLLVDSDDDILETIDDGETWTNLASGITPVPLALARLDKNIQETVFGNQGDTTDNINYSINSGIDLEDYTSGFDKERDITGLEVG
jgi:phosphopantothenoylcysteine synthetase/decarboxylase